MHDFAASRANYTMFYIAEAFLWHKGLSFSSHAAVVSAFGREIAKPEIVPIQFHRYLLTIRIEEPKPTTRLMPTLN
ncbi:MAG: hypothetical protein ACFBSG_19905 [Leptolyngbyaceae cyanobacterium]